MKFLKCSLQLLAIASLLATTSESFAQQKRTPVKPARKVTATAPAITPAFDTLLATDSYKIYVEVRGVGQLIRSNSVNELLDPVMKLAAPPKEFKTLMKWLN